MAHEPGRTVWRCRADNIPFFIGKKCNHPACKKILGRKDWIYVVTTEVNEFRGDDVVEACCEEHKP